jgi:hypothetical protein
VAEGKKKALPPEMPDPSPRTPETPISTALPRNVKLLGLASLTIRYSCHKASHKPYLRPQVPAEPETKIINYDPKADWPR